MRYRALRDNVDHHQRFISAGEIVDYGPDEPVSRHFEQVGEALASPTVPVPDPRAEGLTVLGRVEDADGLGDNPEILSTYTKEQLRQVALSRFGLDVPTRATKVELIETIRQKFAERR